MKEPDLALSRHGLSARPERLKLVKVAKLEIVGKISKRELGKRGKWRRAVRPEVPLFLSGKGGPPH
jgi:hypothetical protein